MITALSVLFSNTRLFASLPASRLKLAPIASIAISFSVPILMLLIVTVAFSFTLYSLSPFTSTPLFNVIFSALASVRVKIDSVPANSIPLKVPLIVLLNLLLLIEIVVFDKSIALKSLKATFAEAPPSNSTVIAVASSLIVTLSPFSKASIILYSLSILSEVTPE